MGLFQKIKGAFDKFTAPLWKRKHKEAEDADEIKAPEPIKKREKNRELHSFLKSLRGRLQEVDIADLIRKGMDRKDRRHMVKRFRAYAVKWLFINRPGSIVDAVYTRGRYKANVRALVTNKGKMLPIGVVK